MCKRPNYSSKGGISEDAEMGFPFGQTLPMAASGALVTPTCSSCHLKQLVLWSPVVQTGIPFIQRLYSHPTILYRNLSFPLTAELLAEEQPPLLYAHRAPLFLQPVRHRTDFHGFVRDVQHRALKQRQPPAGCKTSSLFLSPLHNSQQQKILLL